MEIILGKSANSQEFHYSITASAILSLSYEQFCILIEVFCFSPCVAEQPLKSSRVFTVSIRFWVCLNLLSPSQVWAGEVLGVGAGASQGVAG